MISLIKGCRVYSPNDIGIKDVLLAGGKIEGIYDNIELKDDLLKINIIDGNKKLMFPGFIDSHVHIIGGGGEGGYHTRTPEIQLSSLIESGITSVVGCIGTDGVCRDMNSLIAKVKSLKEEGMSAYAYTGSYEVPVKTATESIKSDLMIIDEIIGVGEIALSDHRSSQPSFDGFVNLVAQSRVGGLLSNKAGIVNVHLGEGMRRLKYLFDLIEQTEIPAEQLLPTHINRNSDLFEMGLEYVKKGGYIDLTTSCDLEHMENGELRAGEGLGVFLEKGMEIEHMTFSSDGNGSMPRFDKNGNLAGLGICSVSSLYREVKFAIKEFNVPIDKAISVITSNVAKLLKLNNKGRIEEGKDADLVIVDEDNLEIDIVFANGKKVVEKGKAVVKGTFEQ
ncbi:beta-aspartyl-peptidase [Clostridium butyricum]|uniref:beta-aspartyl-peptidase n=1 Tax=Clostridium butyricum TaxID=1492 RepID=UPI00325B250B